MPVPDKAQKIFCIIVSRLFTVLLFFFRKIIEIERFALQATILHECQNYLGGGAVWEEARKIEGL